MTTITKLKAALAAVTNGHTLDAKIEIAAVIAEMEAGEPVAWMAESKSGNARFTNIGQSADELESMGWKITPLAVVGAKPKAEPVAWVWNPAKEAWEQVHMFGNWQQGAIYAFGPIMPAQPKAEPVQELTNAPCAWRYIEDGEEMYSYDEGFMKHMDRRLNAVREAVAPQAKPLTDDQIDSVTFAQWGEMKGYPLAAHRAYARAIEAAHKIYGNEND